MAARTTDDRDFLHGLAAGLGSLARDHDRPSMALNILTNLGVTVADLRRAKVDGFDLAPLAREARVSGRQRKGGRHGL